MRKLILLTIILINFSYGQNRLLNLQYINQQYNITQLNKSLANQYLDGVDLFSAFSAGDVLVTNQNGQWYKMLFMLDKYWDRIVYTRQNTIIIKAYGSSGHGNGQFFLPYDLKVMNDGSIFVADTQNKRIVRLLFDFSSETISFDSNISTGIWTPRSIAIGRSDNFGGNLVFIGTTENKLIINLNGANYRFPNDFGGSHWPNSLFTSGAYNVAVEDPYLFLIDWKGERIHVLVYNNNVNDPTLLFTQHFSYPLESDTYGIKKFEVHGSYPHTVAYFVDRNSSLKMKVLSSNNIPMVTPGVQGKPNAQFDGLAALGIEPDYGDIFIGEKWSNTTGGYWYALGPEIQVLNQNNLGYDNLNEFTYTLPEITKVTADIIKPDGTLLERLFYEQSLFPGYQFINFDEYHNSSYLPYGTYQLKLTAVSAYPKEGSASNATSITTLNFIGGVDPVNTDIQCSANYIIQGRTYSIRMISNSKSYNPEPLYTDNWVKIPNNSNGNFDLTDQDETGSPYRTQYRASDGQIEKDMNYVDKIGVRVSFNGEISGRSEANFVARPHAPNPHYGCPILYINEKAIVNVLPQSETSKAITSDRIPIPKVFTKDSILKVSFKEHDYDITQFESIELIIEDVEKGTKICRTGGGMALSYSTKKNAKVNYLYGKAVTSGDTISSGDTLIVETDENGEVAVGVEGETEMDPQYPVYKDTYVKIEEEDEGSSKNSYFIDAAYTRTYPYEDIFYLPDSIQSKSSRKFRLVFMQDYILDSISVYTLGNNKQNFPITSSKIYPTFEIENISPDPWPVYLEPGKEIKMSFKLPPVPKYYERYAYLKVTGRYKKAGLSSLLQSDLLPKKYELFQNFPNPFNPETNIAFAVPYPSVAKFEIFNILGQKIWDIKKEYGNGGYYSIKWDGRNNMDKKLATGLYIYRLTISNKSGKQQFISQKKMLILK